MTKKGIFCPDTALFTKKYLDLKQKNSKSKRRVAKKLTKKHSSSRYPRGIRR